MIEAALLAGAEAAPIVTRVGTMALTWGTRAVGFVAVSTVGVAVGNTTLRLMGGGLRAVSRGLSNTVTKLDDSIAKAEAEAEARQKAKTDVKKGPANDPKAFNDAVEAEIAKRIKAGTLANGIPMPPPANAPKAPPAAAE